jgi:hypothetical protein
MRADVRLTAVNYSTLLQVYISYTPYLMCFFFFNLFFEYSISSKSYTIKPEPPVHKKTTQSDEKKKWRRDPSVIQLHFTFAFCVPKQRHGCALLHVHHQPQGPKRKVHDSFESSLVPYSVPIGSSIGRLSQVVPFANAYNREEA